MNGLVKICGVKTRDTIEAAAAAGATHIGLMFSPKSDRKLTLADAADLSRGTPHGMLRVAVTTDASDEVLASILEQVRPHMFQLHGQEEPQRVAHIRARFGLPVIRALGVATVDDVRAARAYVTCADMLLFDAKPPPGDAATGGHGKAFDWTILQGQSFTKPWMLSGGLTPNNVAEAIRSVRPPGVDVSSGVESSRGVKDNYLISQFCAAAIRAFGPETVA